MPAVPGSTMTEIVTHRQEVFLGPLDPGAEGQAAAGLVTPDRGDGPHSTRLWQEDELCFIEDLGGRLVTEVDGQALAGRSKVRFAPGALIRTGAVCWTAVPADWLFLRHGQTILLAPYIRAFSYATVHCGVPLAGPFTVRNLGPDAAPAWDCLVQVVGASERLRLRVPALAPRATAVLPPAELRLDADRLRGVVDPWRTQLRVQAQSGEAPVERDVHVLGLWDWPCSPPLWRTLAAYVSPRSPVVQQLAQEATECLQRQHHVASVGELLRSGRPDAERLCLEALFTVLRDRRHIAYAGPRQEQLPDGQRYQAILPPHRILANQGTAGSATCLDLAALLAAGLEYLGVLPLLLLTGATRQAPSHALAGCWTGPAPGSRAVTEDLQYLRREGLAGRLLVVEATGVARAFQADPLAFADAVAPARNRQAATPWACAVDIGASRPPYGSITPLDSPFDPAVARAYGEAWKLARRKRRESVEMAHLLGGLLAARGDLLATLCASARVDPDALFGRLLDVLPAADADGEPGPTRNVCECQRLAADLAWRGGSRSVREPDLLWAVLLKAPHSPAFQRTCTAIGLDLGALTAALKRSYPCPQGLVSSALPCARPT